MEDNRTIAQRWDAYQPSKTLWFWSLAGVAILTMILGFTAGGWTTGGTAKQMALMSARDARAELVANLCVEKFVSAADASQNLAKLKETSSYQRDSFITDGGWINLAGMKNKAPGAADLCADKLAAMDAIPARSVSPSQTSG
ncbi:hypothetical protein CN311_25425 [Mesorhizobium sanjuanii]|uniref:Uncharacterized protein n=1 Tax=Mesorhizobium sanjuanii TaxID=2037900 RepID=A0A2A6F8N7_9HYPH|nr:hypothetical protein [Mesorhizobium sanjuanii]PDQ18307.1 hypothetical protein CN311_25425 [Mesorhizobium sanjuanii]